MVSMNDWILTTSKEPPQNVKLDTLSEDGQRRELIYYEQQWWHSDMGARARYTPKHWRETSEHNFALEQ